jgi:hypothetical protein
MKILKSKRKRLTILYFYVVLLALEIACNSVVTAADFFLVDAINKSTIRHKADIFSSVDEIKSNPVGQILLDKISELLNMEGLSCAFEVDDAEGIGTRFEPNNALDILADKTQQTNQIKLKILIDSADVTKNNFTEAIGRRRYKINNDASTTGSGSTITQNQEERLRYIGSCESEFDELLVHELFHMKHCLEEIRGIAIYDGQEKTVNETMYVYLAHIKYFNATALSSYSLGIINSFPEIAAETSNISHNKDPMQTKRWPLWNSFEERRAVAGPDRDGLTENAYRIAKRSPLRYIYQGAEVFMEPTSAIDKFIETQYKDFKYAIREDFEYFLDECFDEFTENIIDTYFEVVFSEWCPCVCTTCFRNAEDIFLGLWLCFEHCMTKCFKHQIRKYLGAYSPYTNIEFNEATLNQKDASSWTISSLRKLIYQPNGKLKVNILVPEI